MEFVYNCYEIGSYSLGIVKANVTWDELLPFLKEELALPWMPFYTKGVYTVYGKVRLTDSVWTVVSPDRAGDCNFFKGSVRMKCE